MVFYAVTWEAAFAATSAEAFATFLNVRRHFVQSLSRTKRPPTLIRER
jgi:hypothetical protein